MVGVDILVVVGGEVGGYCGDILIMVLILEVVFVVGDILVFVVGGIVIG